MKILKYGYYLLATSIIFFNILNLINIQLIWNNFPILYIYSFLSFLIFYLINIPLTYYVNYFIGKLIINHDEKKANIEVSDIKYFREIIPGGAPGIVGLMIDKKIDYKTDIIATIISLENRGYIKIEDNKIIVLKKEGELFLNERYILDNYKFIFSERDFKKRWIELVGEDCEKSGFLSKQKRKDLFVVNKLFIVLFVLVFLFMLIPQKIESEVKEIGGISVLFMGTIIGFVLTVSDKHIIRYKEYKRTKEGYELYQKLLGLRNFLKDFSIINERKQEEFLLWEDYMIYAILFGFKGLLRNEVLEKYEKYKVLETLIR